MHAERVSLGVSRIARPGATGTVLSVHRHAVNLRLSGSAIDDRGDGGRLVSILATAHGGLPNAIEVRPSDAPSLRRIRPGSGVRVGADTIELEAGLVVRLTGAAAWDPRLAAIAPVQPGLRERLAVARVAVRGAGPGGLDGQSPFAPTAAPWLDWLRRGLRLGTEAGRTQATEAGCRLIGLGPGLTPSGDDLLVGLTAALTATAHPWARTLALAWAGAAPSATTPVAAAFHGHAAAAEYAELVGATLRAILVGQPDEVAGRVREAAGWGASSGRDLLAGLLLGLEAGLDPQGRLS